MFIYQRVCEIGCWMQFKACVSAVLCLAVLNHDQAYDERQPKHQNMANGTQDVGELWLQCWLSRACGERNGPTKKDGHVGEKKKVLCSHFGVAASNFLDFRGMTIYSNNRWDSHIFQCLNHVPPSCDCKQISLSPKNIGSSAHCFWIFLDTVVALQSEKSSGPADKLSFHQTGWWGFQRVDCHKLHDIW